MKRATPKARMVFFVSPCLIIVHNSMLFFSGVDHLLPRRPCSNYRLLQRWLARRKSVSKTNEPTLSIFFSEKNAFSAVDTVLLN